MGVKKSKKMNIIATASFANLVLPEQTGAHVRFSIRFSRFENFPMLFDLKY